MKFKACDVSEIGKVSYDRYCCNLDLIDKFVESGLKCVELEDYPHKTPQSCRESFYLSIKRSSHSRIKVTQRGKRVFLINTAID